MLFAYSNVFAYTVKGAGAASSGQYIEDTRNSPRLEHIANMHWVYGFITGVNYSLSTNYGRGVDTNAMAQYLENYCLDNPLKDLADASESLLNALNKR